MGGKGGGKPLKKKPAPPNEKRPKKKTRLKRVTNRRFFFFRRSKKPPFFGVQNQKSAFSAGAQGAKAYRPMSKRFIKPPISRATSINSEYCRLPTTSVLSKNRNNYAPTSLINKSEFLKATHCTGIRKNGIPRSMVVEALSW